MKIQVLEHFWPLYQSQSPTPLPSQDTETKSNVIPLLTDEIFNL